MPRQSSVCAHASLHAIDTAIVAGGAYRDIAGRYALSKSAVERHAAEHLPKLLTRAKEEGEIAHALEVVAQLKAINAASVAILAEARTAGDGDLALKAIDRIHRQVELQAKLLGDLDERPVINVLMSAEWQQLRGQIVAALAPFPEARVAVAAVLAC